MSENDSIIYTPFASLEEAEEFAYELSGVNYKVIVHACSCGCKAACVFSVPPGRNHPVIDGMMILHPGPYRREHDLIYSNPFDNDQTPAA